MSRLATRPYRRGLQGQGNGLCAWLQPDGGWGWSNAERMVVAPRLRLDQPGR